MMVFGVQKVLCLSSNKPHHQSRKLRKSINTKRKRKLMKRVHQDNTPGRSALFSMAAMRDC